MLIAYLLKQHKVWKGCYLRIFAIGDTDPAKADQMKAGLQKYIYMLRIDAEVFVSLEEREGCWEICRSWLYSTRR